MSTELYLPGADRPFASVSSEERDEGAKAQPVEWWFGDYEEVTEAFTMTVSADSRKREAQYVLRAGGLGPELIEEFPIALYPGDLIQVDLAWF